MIKRYRLAATSGALLLVLAPTTMAQSLSVLDGALAERQHDYGRAKSIWLPLAQKGNADAQFYLGDLYFEGLGVKQDNSEAAKWLRLSAEKPNTVTAAIFPSRLLRFATKGNIAAVTVFQRSTGTTSRIAGGFVKFRNCQAVEKPR